MTSWREGVIWAAGLFEGEGTFVVYHRKARGYAGAALGMTDEDTVRRFASVVGFGKVYGPYRANDPTRKLYWRWEVSTFERVQALAAMFWPWLGIRRKQQAKDSLIGCRRPFTLRCLNDSRNRK